MTTRTTNTIWLPAVAAVLFAAGCGPSPSGDAAPNAASGGMPGMPNMPQTAEHVAQGTINSVDQALGTVNISHGPIASANWPAMSMSFKLANPSSASDLEPGERVEFRFTIQSGMDATVTEIKPVE